MIRRISIATLVLLTGLVTSASARQVVRPGAGPGPMLIVREPAPLDLMAPLVRWDDGMPLGNGTLGALVWGGENVLRISLDRGDLWDERLPPQLTGADWTYTTLKKLVADGNEAKLHELFDTPYEKVAYPSKLPVGRIELVFPEGQNARMFRLDLSGAEVTVGVTPARFRAHVVATKNLIRIRVDQGVPELRLVPAAGVTKLGYSQAKVEREGSETWFEQTTAGALKYAVAVRELRDAHGGTDFAIAITTNRENPEPLAFARTLNTFANDYEYDSYLEQNHIGRWAQFWKTSKVKLSDTRLQAQYDLAKYFYGVGSRIGAPPMALQGLWTADEGGLPPWKGDYHNDLNTQMTYIAYPESGLFSEGQAFTDYLWQRKPRFEQFAKSFYDVSGMIAPGVMTLDGQAVGGWSQYALSPTNSAWLAQCFYQHWRYTMDPDFLSTRAYPWCAGVGRALASLLVANEQGKLRLPLSSSPEMFDNSMKAWLAPNSNYDSSLLQWLFGALQEMAAASGNQGDVETWAKLRANLEPLDTEPDTGALTIARGLPYRESHRHLSHAMAIFPLGLIDIEGTPAERKTIDATFKSIETAGTGEWKGYSFAWFACMCARAGKGEQALANLEKFLSYTNKNGFHLNEEQGSTRKGDVSTGPFTLEGNMLAMQAVNEMLLQSWGGVVRVFPAVSERWKDVSFEELRTDGGCRVSAQRVGGVTTSVTILARSAGKLVLRDPFAGREPQWTGNKPAKLESREFQQRVKLAKDAGQPAPTDATYDYVFDVKPGEQLEGKLPDATAQK